MPLQDVRHQQNAQGGRRKKIKIAWIDLETGGFSPRYGDVTEIAGIIEIDGKVAEEFDFYLRPENRWRIGTHAAAIQGKTVDEIMDHPMSQREGAQAFIDILERYYFPGQYFLWAGQNPMFDIQFASDMLSKTVWLHLSKWFEPNPIDLIDSVMEARRRGHFRGMINNKLATVTEFMEIPHENAHNALSDIRATRAAFWKIADMMRPPSNGA